MNSLRVTRRTVLKGVAAVVVCVPVRRAGAADAPAPPDARITKLEEYYATLYAQPLASPERLPKEIAVMSLSRIDVYKSWDYQQGHGLMWVYLETRMEPGIRPLGSPRFEVSEIRDEAGNELPRDAEMQECSPKGPSRDGLGRSSGSVYERKPAGA